MSEQRHINDAGLKIIKLAEGYRAKPYTDKNDGWTVGYGHLLRPAELENGRPIKELYNEEECASLLRLDVTIAETLVRVYAKVDLTDNQFSALCSFAYNLGAEYFRTSTLLRMLNQGDRHGAAGQFKRWRKDDGLVRPGLVKRRMIEEALFLSSEPDALGLVERLFAEADAIYRGSQAAYGRITNEAMDLVRDLAGGI